jgi:exonuclease SbcC
VISRLLELKLSGFRCFPEEATIPFDADVVLIHGLNGTGKTTLLTAIEFAVSGCVEELSAFETDYPRCLRNVRNGQTAFTSVTYVDGDASEQTSEHRVIGDRVESTARSSHVRDIRFFRDRCYLSQSSLGRLLETYQAHETSDGEQPLVRYIRELLGLEVLDNITAGLFEAKNITRIEKSVPVLARAREDERILSDEITEQRVELVRATGAWQQALSELQTVAGQVGDPAPGEPWTPDGVKLRIRAHAQQMKAESVAPTLQRLRHGQGRLQRVTGILGIESAHKTADALRRRLKDAVARLADLEKTIRPATERAEQVLRQAGHSIEVQRDISARIAGAEAALRSLISKLSADSEAAERTRGELAQLKSTESDIAERLNNLEPTSGRDLSQAQRWAETLGSMLEYVRGDDCPVCGRDYSEVGRKTLKQHIHGELESLAADAKRMEAIARKRAPLAARLVEIRSRLAATETALKAVEGRAKNSDRALAPAQAATVEIASLAKSRDDWQQLTLTIKSLQAEISVAGAKERQQTEAIKEIGEILKELPIPKALRETDPLKLATVAATFVGQEAETLERQTAAVSRLSEALKAASSVGETLNRVQQKITDATRQLERAQKTEALIRARLSSARHLAKAAVDAKTSLLSQVFNDTLNSLWRELFRRLVKHEYFQPRLAEPTNVRGQIRTSIQGWRNGVDVFFEQFAAVASSGNLNTAALSLFLSLNLIEQPRHRLLLLDDPVQAMDDVHVVQLASLLREIRRQAKRQLILSVHERALFDYLRLELSPTGVQSSLRTIELRRMTDDGAPEIETAHHPWKPDKVSFDVERRA